MPLQCRQTGFVDRESDCQVGIAIARRVDQNAPDPMTIVKHRWALVAVALVAATAFALSVQGGRWWSIGDTSIGPLGAQSPFGGLGGLSWAGGSARWERFGTATFAAGLMAMFVLIFVAGALAARRMPRLAAKTALVAIATAALVGTAFVVARPDNGLPFALDRGVALFAGAVIAGAIAAAGVLRKAEDR
jgi:hypothetical protein